MSESDEIKALREEIERLTEDNKWAECDIDASDEISAELFQLCCAVVDGNPNAAAARDALREHIEHVMSCRKGSCATELGRRRAR